MTDPYYRDDLVTLYLGDARTIPEWTSADVLVTDPPYGQDWRPRSGARTSGLPRSIANDLDTRVRDDLLGQWGPDRLAVVFGNLLLAPPTGTVHVLIYGKPIDAGITRSRAGRRKDVEAIYLLGPWPMGTGGASSVLRTGGLVAGPRGISVRAGHPHAKPLDVMGELVALHPTGTIADPCAGSGQTLIAATYAGRPSIGCEVDEQHAENTARRLQQAGLFTDPQPKESDTA